MKSKNFLYHFMALLLFFWLFFIPGFLVAGGSYEPVLIEKINIFDITEYNLVVKPIKINKTGAYKDPYMGDCDRFIVIGTYRQTFPSFPEFVTRNSHLEALEYLRKAQERKKIVKFGWMGSGFAQIDHKNPCIVKSRALNLYKFEGEIAVISYYEPV